MKRIALSGKMASGKSLIAAYLVKKYGFTEVSIAAKVKQLAKDLFGVTKEQNPELGRRVLQQLAGHMREIDPDVWIHMTLNSLPPGDIVVSDLRFPNECEYLIKAGFLLVRMEPGESEHLRLVAKSYPGIPVELLTDISETALDAYHFDYHILNTASNTLESLYEQADGIIQHMEDLTNE